ncbi:UDP-3-O-(3-hydroxymyristoyl)glucosamine N-acyltransferase [Chitinibacteraceae bacterium HSL-7]
MMKLSELAQALGAEWAGEDVVVLRVASLERGTSDAIGFVTQPRYLAAAQASQLGALIVRPDWVEQCGKPCLIHANPYLLYSRVARLLHPEVRRAAGIAHSASVDPSAQLDASASIGPNVVVGAGAVVGAGVQLDANVTVGDNARIGAQTRCYPGVFVGADCVVGERVVLHPGAVIGSDGFGNAWNGVAWEKIPQIGRVIIGDDVEIGSNTTVDRGALDDTVIAAGARVDNLIQIAHNVEIGAHTALAGCVGIAGSTKIGARCQIGGAAMISGHLEICDGAVVLGGTLVAKSIKQPGAYSGSYPMQPHGDWAKNAAQLRHLDALADRVKQLEKQLAAHAAAAGHQA